VKRLADQCVDDIRPVELRRVDVVDAEFDGAPQNGERLVPIARWAEDAGPRELHRTESDASYVVVPELGCVRGVHAHRVRYGR
jgi:hypothetical protein